MARLPFISEADEGIYTVCTVANTDYPVLVPARAIGAVLWFEASATNSTPVVGRFGVDAGNLRLGTDNIVTGGGPLPATGVTVTFTGALGNTNVAVMTATSSLTGGTTPAVTVTETTAGGPGVNEVQTITITGAPTGGTFTLTYGGQTTAAIAYDATAAQVKAALDALTSITLLTNTSTNLAYHPAQAVEYDIVRSYRINNRVNTADTVYLHLACNIAGAIVRGMWLYGGDA